MVELRSRGHDTFAISRRTGHDLTDDGVALRAFSEFHPDVVVHLSARLSSGGMGVENYSEVFSENVRMGLNVVEAAVRLGARVVAIGSASSYPENCVIPFREEDLWAGLPVLVDRVYGTAKREIANFLWAYWVESRIPSTFLIPATIYGPGFRFQPETTGLVPTFIRRISDATAKNEKSVTFFGTGLIRRSFLFVRDAAAAIALACEFTSHGGVVNLPGNSEITLRELASHVARIVGFEGKIEWEGMDNEFVRRRVLDGTRATSLLGWSSTTTLADGLNETFEWYRSKS